MPGVEQLLDKAARDGLAEAQWAWRGEGVGSEEKRYGKEQRAESKVKKGVLAFWSFFGVSTSQSCSGMSRGRAGGSRWRVAPRKGTWIFLFRTDFCDQD